MDGLKHIHSNHYLQRPWHIFLMGLLLIHLFTSPVFSRSPPEADRGPFHFFNRDQIQWKLRFARIEYPNRVIATKLCTWHSRYAFVSCAHIGNDLVPRNRMTTRDVPLHLKIVGEMGSWVIMNNSATVCQLTSIPHSSSFLHVKRTLQTCQYPKPALLITKQKWGNVFQFKYEYYHMTNLNYSMNASSVSPTNYKQVPSMMFSHVSSVSILYNICIRFCFAWFSSYIPSFEWMHIIDLPIFLAGAWPQ